MDLFVVLVLSIFEVFSLLIGSLIVFSTKNNKKVMTFSVALGFIVLILLGLFHLIPDAYLFYKEGFDTFKSILFTCFFIIIGFAVVIVLDVLGGHHHHEEKSAYKHIFFITCVFLVIHNFIEGMTLYSTVLTSYDTAVILTLGIALHNLPLGFTLSSTFNELYGKSKTLLCMIGIGISYLFGALVLYKFTLNAFIIGTLLSFTFGMIMYIACFEFLPLIKDSKDKKMVNMGILCGIILMLITMLF